MNLRKWLFNMDLTVTSFAFSLKIDRSYVHKMMNGTRVPSSELMKRIRKATMNRICTVKHLLDDRVKNKKNKKDKE